MIINSYNIRINPIEILSTMMLQKEGYIFSFLDHIQCIFKNLSLFSKMYFRPSVEVSEAIEL